jgi:hypothetical protein
MELRGFEIRSSFFMLQKSFILVAPFHVK